MQKIVSYIGFSIKSNQIVKGLDEILKTKKKIGVILTTKNLKDNSFEKLNKHINNKNIIVLEFKPEQFEKFNLVGVKVLGITDKNLAQAIINEYNKVDK